MSSKRIFPVTFLIILTLSLGLLGGTGLGASQATECQPIGERQLCIADFAVSGDRVVVGEMSEFTFTIVNRGNTTASGKVLLHTASPENETDVFQFRQITLEPDEEHTISRKINASTPGTHGLRLTLSEPATQHVYDVSEIKTVEVLEAHPKELGGPIDRTEIALVALVASLVAMVWFGYRKIGL